MESIEVPPSRQTQSGRRPPVTETGAMLFRYWQTSGLSQTEICRLGKVRPSAFSAYCHHAQVAPLDVMEAYQKAAGWSDAEVLGAHERDTEARAKWAAVGKKRGGKRAAESRLANRKGSVASAAKSRVVPVPSIGRLVQAPGSPHERAERYVRGVFDLSEKEPLDQREGTVRLDALYRATVALLAGR